MFVIFFGLDLDAAVATSILIELAGVGTTAAGHVVEPGTDRALAAEVIFVILMSTIGPWLFLETRSTRIVERLIPAAKARRVTLDGFEYEFCRPRQGYLFAGVAGAATSVLGVSGADIQITVLMARCAVSTRIVIGTGIVAAAMGLVGASVFAALSGDAVPSISVVAIPARGARFLDCTPCGALVPDGDPATLAMTPGGSERDRGRHARGPRLTDGSSGAGGVRVGLTQVIDMPGSVVLVAPAQPARVDVAKDRPALGRHAPQGSRCGLASHL